MTKHDKIAIFCVHLSIFTYFATISYFFLYICELEFGRLMDVTWLNYSKDTVV